VVIPPFVNYSFHSPFGSSSLILLVTSHQFPWCFTDFFFPLQTPGILLETPVFFFHVPFRFILLVPSWCSLGVYSLACFFFLARVLLNCDHPPPKILSTSLGPRSNTDFKASFCICSGKVSMVGSSFLSAPSCPVGPQKTPVSSIFDFLSLSLAFSPLVGFALS